VRSGRRFGDVIIEVRSAPIDPADGAAASEKGSRSATGQPTPASLRKDLVGPNGEPDDVRLAGTDFRPVREDGTTVFRPSHLEATGHPLDPLHAEARSEPTAPDVIDEATDRTSERLPLLVSEGAEVPQEALGDRISRHD